jgi:hypothetical protein
MAPLTIDTVKQSIAKAMARSSRSNKSIMAAKVQKKWKNGKN